MLEYETANPGQDQDDKEAKEYDPERDAADHSPRYGSPSGNARSTERSRPGSSKSRQGVSRTHERTLNRSPARVPASPNGNHEIPRRAVPGETRTAQGASHAGHGQSPTDTTTVARNIQEHSANRHSGHFRGSDSGRASKEHVWPEGHTVDSSGQRTYV